MNGVLSVSAHKSKCWMIEWGMQILRCSFKSFPFPWLSSIWPAAQRSGGPMLRYPEGRGGVGGCQGDGGGEKANREEDSAGEMSTED